MKIEWDKEYHRVEKTSVYQEELEEIGRFIKSNHRNICFTYEMEVLAKNAMARLGKITESKNIPVKLMRRKNEIYIYKKSN